MVFFKRLFLSGLVLTVLGLIGVEYYKQADFKPQIELEMPARWQLTEYQKRQFRDLNKSFSSQISWTTFVSDFRSIFNNLVSLDFVSDARWAWDFKAPLKIKALPSEPKVLMFKNNQWYLINEKGKTLRRVSAHQALDLPIYRSEKLLIDSNLREKSFSILKSFADSSSAIPLSAVSEVSLDSRGVSFLLSEGFKVYLSDRKTKTQIARVSNVITYLKKEHVEVDFIDAQLVQKILVRPKKR